MLPTLVLALTTTTASAAQIAAAPCASGPSVARGLAAMHPFFVSQVGAEQARGVVLLDCRVRQDRRLTCAAASQTDSRYDLSGAALAFAGELEVCPGTPQHLKFPLVFRADARATPDPSP
jgi:hypothetical protein